MHTSLLDALAKARASGIAAELLSGIEPEPHAMLISLVTSDPETMLVVRRHGLRPEPVDELLEAREESGADRWDYPFSVRCWRDRMVLRLRRGTSVRDIEILRSAATVLRALGWSDDPNVLVPAVVVTAELDDALAAISAAAATCNPV